MPNLARLVGMHKQVIKALIDQSDVQVSIRLPIAQLPGATNPFFGNPARENNITGQTLGPFNCLWYDAFSVRSSSPSGGSIERMMEQSPGQFREADAFIQVWLEDVLTDPSNVYSLTYFDQALHIIIFKQRYKVLGVAKTSLSTSAPYILTVALRGGLGYEDA